LLNATTTTTTTTTNNNNNNNNNNNIAIDMTQEIGRRITTVTEYTRETIFLNKNWV